MVTLGLGGGVGVEKSIGLEGSFGGGFGRIGGFYKTEGELCEWLWSYRVVLLDGREAL
ncbi:hypothetical protein [Sutcliffiella horikoshii]|uniref:hypothetical protein n=1 Tax=Sutcliffiella horikoshii TaxID=79883 RepID=UPI001653580C|nr:hypothetical protein [Sutcliffiella horikoshii]